MLRRCLALFLGLALVLGWTGAIASAGCGAPTGKPAAMLSAVPDGCGTCENDNDDKGQPQQGCAVLACTAGCVSGPATAADATSRQGRVTSIERTAPAPQDALRARPIPPDHPPPR